ncbi:MAG: SDR family NAD(P)-dependent oxidoreductase [Candidatus Heimdallarchaeota archaeon]
MDSGLDGEHVLITGASGGIGQAIAKAFDGEGCKLSLHYNNDEKGITQLIQTLNDDCCVLKADLTSERQTEQLFQDGISANGRIDRLVINHGVWPEISTPVHEMELDQWDRTIGINLRAAFICSKFYMQNLATFPKATGSVVYIGSTAGIFGEAGHADYAISKAGLLGLMLSLKNEIVQLAYRGRVNMVAPGWTKTPMAENSLKDETLVRSALQTMPLRKIALPSDIANTVLFLSSDRLAGHISGQIVTVAGGMEGRKLFDPNEIEINEI